MEIAATSGHFSHNGNCCEQVRQNISRLLDKTANGNPVMITRHGRPAGYLIGYKALNQLLERLEDMEDLY